MDDDDWDLHAVVKGCATVSGTTVNNSSESPLPNFQDQENSEFDFPGLLDERNVDPFEGLQEIYREFCVDPPPIGVDSVTVSQPHHEIVHMQGQQDHVQFKNPGSISLPVVNSQPIRPRRRKNQQMKMVREMTQEELSGDSWAWRKYGQKPIKGSPYPRNYYRCSTSKGCAARKQVERSPNDPLIYVVSYTGEHTHPRPTHRSSLAGSTRNKLSSAAAAKNKNNNNINKHLLQNGLSSSSASGSSFSPSSPLMGGEATTQNDVLEMEEDGRDEEEEEDNNAKIPNDDDDDIFKMFQDSDHSSGGGDHLFSSGLLSSPPWTPTNSVGGGGG